MAYTFKTFEDIRNESSGPVSSGFDMSDLMQPYQEDPDPGPGAVDLLSDMAKAPARATLNTAEGIYDVVDAVAFDLLPDADFNFLGESEYLPGKVGQFGHEVAQAVLSGAGLVAWATKIPRVGSLLNTSARAKTALAGMTADAIMTRSVEDTLLGSLVTQFPQLKNPAFEFLSADEDDSKAALKLKGVVEGLGIGLAFDGVLRGLTAIRKMRKARAEGVITKAVAGDIHKEINDPLVPGQAAADTGLMSAEESRRVADEVGGEGAYDELARLADEDIEFEMSIHDEIVIDVEKGNVPAAQQGDLGQKAVEVQRMAGRMGMYWDAAAKQWTKRMGGDLPPSQLVSPWKQTELERMATHTEGLRENLAAWTTRADTGVMLRMMERVRYDHLQSVPVESVETFFRHGMEEWESWLGKPIDHLILDMAKDTEDFKHLTAKMWAQTDLVIALATDAKKALGLWKKFEGTAQEALYQLRAEQALTKASAAQEGHEKVRTIWSRAGRILDDPRTNAKATTGPGGELFPVKPKQDGYPGAFETPPTAKEVAELEKREAQGMSKAEKKKLSTLHGMLQRDDTLSLQRMLDMQKDGMWQKAIRWGTTYWIHGLLQRPSTWAVNFATTTANVAVTPLEHALGGAIRNDMEEVRYGMDLFGATVRNFFNSSNWKAGLDAAAVGKPTLLPESSLLEHGDVIKQIGTIDVVNRPQDLLRAWYTHGSRVLVGTDEALKRVAYLSKFEAELQREAYKMFPGNTLAQKRYAGEKLKNAIVGKQAMTSDAVWQMAEQQLRDSEERHLKAKGGNAFTFSAKQVEKDPKLEGMMNPAKRAKAKRRIFDRLWDPEMDKKAVAAAEYAKQTTWTNQAAKGSLAQKAQRLVAEHPEARIFMPFVRTPMNIVKHVLDHLDPRGPIAYGVREHFGKELTNLDKTHIKFLQDFAGPNASNATKAQAIGRLTTGWGATLGGFWLAGQGIITGRGPESLGQRMTLKNAGWQPYSFKFGDEYYSYQRFAPYAMFLGMAADFRDVSRLAEAEDNDAVTAIFTGAFTATALNMVEPTYMKGLKNLLDAAMAPDRNAPRMLESMVGSLVPGGVAMLGPVQDDNLRDVRGALDAVWNRIPGLSSSLPPKRNVLGEPVMRTKVAGEDEVGSIMKIWMPVAYSETSHDQISLEMAAIGESFSAPGSRKGSLNLLDHVSGSGQTAYDRWQELQGQVRLSGRSIRQELGRVISGRGYQSLPLEGSPLETSPRYSKINNVIQRYRRAAYEQMLREFPAVSQADALRKQKHRNPYAIL